MEEAYTVDILCINCQNMIRTDLAERHSKVCFVVLPSILALEAGSAIKMIDLKVDKLKCSMETLDSDSSKSLTPADLKLVNRLIQLSIGLLMSQSEQGVDEKVEELSSVQEPENLEEKLEQKRLEAERLREQVDFYRKQTSELQNQFAKHSVEVDSEVGENQLSSRFTSGLSEAQSIDKDQDFHEDLDLLIREQESQVREKSSEELQRYFYSQCLQIKMSISARDPAQGIPLPLLYKKAQSQKVPIEKWPEFIKEELSRAQKAVIQQ